VGGGRATQRVRWRAVVVAAGRRQRRGPRVGALGRDELRTNTGATGATDSDAGWPNGANCPPVTDGKLFLMARVHCRREDGRLVPWNYWSSKEKPGEPGLWRAPTTPES